MSLTEITATLDNGIYRKSDSQTLTNGQVFQETLILSGGARLANNILFNQSQIRILSNSTQTGGGGNIDSSSIAYGTSRSDTNIIEFRSSSLLVETFTQSRYNLFLSRLTDSQIVEIHQSSPRMFLYVQSNSIVRNTSFRGIRVLEVIGAFSEFANVSFIDTFVGMLNWEAGRLDRVGINIPSTISGWYSWIGWGGTGDNSIWDWNPVSIDPTKIIHQWTANRYYVGYTISWIFRDNSGFVNNVLIVVSDNRTGTIQEIGRFTTNSSGKTVSTNNTRNLTTGASQERPIFLLSRRSVVAGTQTLALADEGVSTYDYTLSSVTSYLQIKSYLHLDPGLQAYQAVESIGAIDGNFANKDYARFDLITDPGISQTNTTTVASYSGITYNATDLDYQISGSITADQFYDFLCYTWRQTDNLIRPIRKLDITDIGNTIIRFNAGGSISSTTKYRSFSSSAKVRFGANGGDYSAFPGEGITAIDFIGTGNFDLRNWKFSTANFAKLGGGTATVTVDASQIPNITAGSGVVVQSPPVLFSAPNINAGGFDNVRCRTSLYLRVAFDNTSVNAATNQITLAGSSGKITQNTVVRLAGTDLPAPLEPDQVFYPRTISGNSFTLSNQPGGAGSDIDLTDTGSGSMVAILTTELNNALVTSGGYSFNLGNAASAAGVTLATNDSLLFQAVHWKGSLQSVSPCVASRYHEEFQSYQGSSVLTLTNLDPYTEHDLFAVRQATDGYAISQLTVSGSSPLRYQWRVDASAPGRVQIESEDPDRVISTELAVLYFQYMQWTLSGIRLFRGQIEAENLNSIVIKSPEVGVAADLTVESFPPGIPLLVNGPGMYRADGQTWIAVGSPIQHQPTALVAVPITVEKAVNLSPEVMQMLHSIAAGTAIATQATGGGGGLDAAGVRAAIGLASANLDTQLSNIPSNVWSNGTRVLTAGTNIILPNSQTFSTSGSVGSINGVTFPTNFSALAITPTTGLVSVGTNNDKTGYLLSSTQSFNLTGNITGNLSGSVGSVTSAVTLPTIPTNWITAAGINNGAITATKFATDAIDSNAIAASAVSEIQSGLATSSAVNTILNNTNRVDGLITNPGGGDRFTTLALSNAPTGGGSDSPGVTTLLSRLTSTRANNLDFLDVSISSRSTYAGTDTAGTTTLLSRLTSTRAGYLDNLSGGAVMLASSYTSPDNTSILAIKAKTDQLGFTSGNVNAIALAGSVSVSSVANDAITAAALSADAIAEIQSGLATSAQVVANGFTGSDRTALLSAQSAALAVADGRQKINYLASTFTIYNVDGSVRRVFNLRDQDNNAASSAATAVERIPQ